ncbi:MAG: DUF924 family protein [Chlamydiota bacterium]|nr:DUF924 family protein [Chlamydiota bacterium]
MSRYEEILEFWFGDIHTIEDRLEDKSKYWFNGGERVDLEIKQKFLDDVILAAQGKLNHWRDHPCSTLALVILLDQFSLNIWREQKRAFDQSLMAVPIVLDAIEKHFDQQVTPIERVFYYLPIEHVEDLAMQDKSVELFTKLLEDATENQKIAFEIFLDYAIRHRDAIVKFGRFPGRNKGLGRASSAEEAAYLEQQGGF